MEVVSDNGLKVDTGVSKFIGIIDVSDIAIDVCFDVDSVVDTWMSWWFIACLPIVPFLSSSSTAMQHIFFLCLLSLGCSNFLNLVVGSVL